MNEYRVTCFFSGSQCSGAMASEASWKDLHQCRSHRTHHRSQSSRPATAARLQEHQPRDLATTSAQPTGKTWLSVSEMPQLLGPLHSSRLPVSHLQHQHSSFYHFCHCGKSLGQDIQLSLTGRAQHNITVLLVQHAHTQTVSYVKLLT